MVTGNFEITKEYIQSLIPSNLRETWTFERVADLFYEALTSNGITGFYNDVEYFSDDFSKLSTEMKIHKLNDSGFSFLSTLFGTDDETLDNLGNYLNLIKMFRGRLEGFNIIMKTIADFSYELKSWLDPDYSGDIFTITMVLRLSSEQVQVSSSVIDRIQKIARAYLAPQVIITYTIVEDLLAEDKYFNAKYSGGYTGITRYPIFTTTRSLT